jgi:hypothetical protein
VKPPPVELLKALREARALIARPGNDFSRTGWRDQAAALEELDALAQSVGERHHGAREQVASFFQSDGALAKLGHDSGWEQAFLALVGRGERALPELSPD